MEFKEFFRSQEDNLPRFGMVMKYNAVRIDKNIRRIIFVEGASDSKFYSSTCIDELSKESRYFYSNSKEERVGKEAVFYTYSLIKSNRDLISDLSRCIFIVDRDWEMSIKSEDNLISGKDRDRFTITQGHSMECYYLEHDNLKIIFSELGIENNLDDFERRLNDFKLKTYHYWALKGAIQYAYKHGIPIRYRRNYEWEEIFAFDFSKEECFDIDKMQEEIVLMENSIGTDRNLISYCEKWDQKIREKYRFIRGHDIFNFMVSYIIHVKGNNDTRNAIEERIKEFVPLFSIDIEIKNA